MMMMNKAAGIQLVDDDMSNLTSASNEASNCSGSNRIDLGATTQTQPAAKKKRNLPGNPDPEAEVIALSPRSLLATNRFVCEICNKGFQRDQNLQLHRRGHNLPWKLKQRNKQEVVRKKVYVCPETTCVHHDPSRALGDLTGIKKHFSRKHGEKKWKCEKCSKRYAVQSDWKAHSKICGTREYRCDCGTLFSRRDSFITHRAFCDALAEESAKSMTSSNPLNILPLHQQQQQTIQLNNLNPINPLLHHHHNSTNTAGVFSLKREQLDIQQQQHGFNFRPPVPPEMPAWLANLPAAVAEPAANPNPNSHAYANMSATALLQKAAQIGVTMSNKPASDMNIGLFSSAGSSLNLSSSVLEDLGDNNRGFFHNNQLGLASFENNKSLGQTDNHHQHHHQHGGGGAFMGLMSSFTSSGNHNGGGFIEGIMSQSPFGDNQEFDGGGMVNSKRDISFQTDHGSSNNNNKRQRDDHNGDGGGGSVGGAGGGGGNNGNNDGLTRDFLSLKVFPQREFISMDDLHHQMAGSSFDHQNPPPWQS
ncbi:OLC1v1025180C1 [Oldenlandia corymbosa var. corymbosa]|uniref:OLC1v1025180C1 n=1 Tax=Oldenlandia corymbosa var. corymbosa TaxID=529605 RepID=A0AAV1CE46_OLDCO|nr:OLC1v1025180C1 [Oldenlandia corymbosa var. corymbosa]